MKALAAIAEKAQQILDEVERAVIGKRAVLEHVLITVLAGGHILLKICLA
jgi:MoxR-like ATPase